MSGFRVCSCLLLVLLFWGSSLAGAAPQIPPAALAKVCSAIVYDLDHDAILFEQNADERIPPASLTKVMSMFLALDFVNQGHAGLDDAILVSSEAAAQGGSRMGLRANEAVSLKKLLLGMAVSSGNDASYAVAEQVGGSADAFVKMMNTRAASLGMNDTNFANPHGLPHPAQYTTARDMLTLARAYLKAHPQSLDLHNTQILEHGGYKTWNKNPLIGQYPGADGLKTGWIRASGYNLIFTAARDKRRLLAVILGAPDVLTRGAEACRLLDAGFLVCGNAAVSVAAALDGIPVDYARIDPRKTARENGIYRPRAIAAKKMTRSRQLLAQRNVRHARNVAKLKRASGNLLKRNARLAQKKQTNRHHADRRLGKTRRG